jgi:hypothetical protein
VTNLFPAAAAVCGKLQAQAALFLGNKMIGGIKYRYSVMNIIL